MQLPLTFQRGAPACTWSHFESCRPSTWQPRPKRPWGFGEHPPTTWCPAGRWSLSEMAGGGWGREWGTSFRNGTKLLLWPSLKVCECEVIRCGPRLGARHALRVTCICWSGFHGAAEKKQRKLFFLPLYFALCGATREQLVLKWCSRCEWLLTPILRDRERLPCRCQSIRKDGVLLDDAAEMVCPTLPGHVWERS